MRKPDHHELTGRIVSKPSSPPTASRTPQLANGLEGADGATSRLGAAQAGMLVRIATKVAWDVWRRCPWAWGVPASKGDLQQVAFLAALSSHRAFDPSRRVSYEAWIWSKATAAVRGYLRDELVLHLPRQSKNGTPSVDRTNDHPHTTGHVATPEAVAQDSGLPSDLVRRILREHSEGFVLYFPGLGRPPSHGSE